MVERKFIAFDNEAFVGATSGVGIINNSDTPVNSVFTYVGGFPNEVITLDVTVDEDVFNDDLPDNHIITDGGSIIANGSRVESESYHFFQELDANGVPFGPTITITVFSAGGITSNVFGMTTDTPLTIGVSYIKIGGSNVGDSLFTSFVDVLATDDTVTGDEDNSVNIDVLSNDVGSNGTALAIQSFSQGTSGTVAIDDNGTAGDTSDDFLIYTPDANFDGSDTLTYVLSDGTGSTDSATVSVTVNPVNDLPVAVDDIGGVNSDAATLVNLAQNDSDVDAGTDLSILSVDDSGALGQITVQSDGDTVSYDPNGAFDGLAAGETGVDTFTYLITDGAGGSDSATVSITVTGVNAAPDALNDVTIGFQDVAQDITVLTNDSDPDGDPLTVISAVVGTPGAGTASVNPNNTINFDPDTAFSGPAQINYSISDGRGGTDSATVTVTIIPNSAPSIQEPVSFVVDEGQTSAADLQAIDPEGDPITWSIIGGPDALLFDIDAATGALSFLSAPQFDTPLDQGGDNGYNLTVQAADALGANTEDILITVRDPGPTGGPPIITGPIAPPGFPAIFVLTSLSQGAVGTVTATDPDNDTLEFQLFGEDTNIFSIDSDSGVVSITDPQLTGRTLPTGFDGDRVYELDVLVSDGNGGSDFLSIELPLFLGG